MNTRTKSLLGGAIVILAASAALAGKPVQPPASGDITGVAAGPGLAGGGTSGDVTLSLRACGAGQSLVWDGVGAWQCQLGGDITGVTAGSGLMGGGNSGPVTLSLPNCAAGELLKSTGTDWACESAPSESVAPAVVVDSVGTVVGPIVPSGATTTVAAVHRVVSGSGTESVKVVFYPMNWDLVIDAPGIFIYFALPSCQGAAYVTPQEVTSGVLQHYAGYSLALVYPSGSANRTFRPDTSQPSTLRNYASRLRTSCEVNYSGSASAWPASETTLNFVGPFSVK